MSRFEFLPLAIPGLILVRTKRFEDSRGFFSERYRRTAFAEGGIEVLFVQDNLARSEKGILRGLHYQIAPAPQGKLVGVLQGRIFDVAVDLRPGSPTFGAWEGVELGEEGALLWIPPGFAHGYQVLSEQTLVSYKTTAEYAPDLDRGVRWDDPVIGIKWPLRDPVVSEKDRGLPLLADAELG